MTLQVQKTEAKGKRILVVCGSKQTVEQLSDPISREGHSLSSASDAESALHRIRAWKPHAVLIDFSVESEGGNDLSLIQRIRSITTEEYVSVGLIGRGEAPEEALASLDRGADDFISSPIQPAELMARLRAMLRVKELQDSLRRYQHRVEELSSTDDLTGVLNMRALYRRVEEEIQRSRRFRKPVSALLVNLDGFASVNELADFGYGNTLLREVGTILRRCVRKLDLVGRMGGDEFFVLLAETDLAGAEFVAERVRDAIAGTEFKSDRQQFKISASIGVAGFAADQDGVNVNILMQSCVDALRTAKDGGAGRIEIYSLV